MSESSSSPVREGDIIAGKYRVERVLGVGGMGVVVAAMHIDLEQRVALKFLLAEASSHAEVAARFAREAKAAAKIQSEHVAKVIDVSTMPNGSPYMVMEYMDGEDLQQVLARHGPMPVDVAVSYVLQACEAIAEAHALGIVHRDIKPSNLFLARRAAGEPVVKVLDFGISKSQASTTQAHLTKTTSILGSPLYMSPEQMASAKTVDTRSDIWALGVVLYEVLAQRTPFPAETMPELIAAVLQAHPDPITQLRPDVPPPLAAAIHRCLEKLPVARFQNVAELAAAIAPFGPPRSDVSVERISHVLGLAQSYSRGTGGPLAMQARPLAQTPIGGAIPAGTNAQWGGSVAGDAARSSEGGKTALLIAIPAVLAIATTVGIVTMFRGNSHAGGGAPASAETSVAAAPPPPVSAAPPAPAPPTPASAAAPEPSAAPSSSAASPVASVASVAPIAPASTTPHVATPSSSPSPAATTAKPSAPSAPTCHMVSYYDADGNKRFKKECK